MNPAFHHPEDIVAEGIERYSTMSALTPKADAQIWSNQTSRTKQPNRDNALLMGEDCKCCFVG